MSYLQPSNGSVDFGLEDTLFPANDTVNFSLEDGIVPPENLQITDDTIAGELSLGWDSVSNVDGYYVYRSTSSGFTVSDYTRVGDTTSTSFTDDGLSQNTEYFYRVTAYGDFGETAVSAEVSATTIEILEAPTGITISKEVQNVLTISWDTVDQADGYYVYRSQSNGLTADDYTQITDTTQTSYEDTGLEDGERYFYRVASYDSTAEKLSSERSLITRLPGYEYTKPYWQDIDFTLEDNSGVSNSSVNFSLKEDDDLNAEINNRGNVELVWGRSDDSTDGDITIQRSSDNKETWNTLDTVAYNVTSYVDDSLGEEGTYYYRIIRFTEHATATSSEVLPYKVYYRNSSVGLNVELESTREPVISYRESQIGGSGRQESAVDLLDVFPDEESLDINWSYQFDPRGFASEWMYEETNIPEDKRGGFGVNFHGELENEINVWIQKGVESTSLIEPKLTSDKQKVLNTRNTPTFEDYEEFSEEGWYRVFIRGLRLKDTVNQVDVGIVHENFTENTEKESDSFDNEYIII